MATVGMRRMLALRFIQLHAMGKRTNLLLNFQVSMRPLLHLETLVLHAH